MKKGGEKGTREGEDRRKTEERQRSMWMGGERIKERGKEVLKKSSSGQEEGKGKE